MEVCPDLTRSHCVSPANNIFILFQPLLNDVPAAQRSRLCHRSPTLHTLLWSHPGLKSGLVISTQHTTALRTFRPENKNKVSVFSYNYLDFSYFISGHSVSLSAVLYVHFISHHEGIQMLRPYYFVGLKVVIFKSIESRNTRITS